MYAAAFYFILFSSLLVHEFGHVYSAQYITKDCMFTETHLTFDLLVLRRGGMTYFTCSHGVEPYEPPLLDVDLGDPTAPTVTYSVGEARGVRLLTSPLTTGWFTALMGPALELIYVTWIVHWLADRFKQIRVIKASYLIFLFMIFVSSRMDFQQAVPAEGAVLFIAGYFTAYMVIALTHVTLNTQYYRSLTKSMAYSVTERVEL